MDTTVAIIASFHITDSYVSEYTMNSNKLPALIRTLCVSVLLAFSYSGVGRSSSALSAFDNKITLASLNSSGIQANDESMGNSVSFDGRYVVFDSRGTNLLENDTNGPHVVDVFRHDRLTGETILISQSSSGQQGNQLSYVGSVNAVSSDGRYVLFHSYADNLGTPLSGGDSYVFVRDTQAGVTKLVSRRYQGPFLGSYCVCPQISSMSNDGRYIVFDAVTDDIVPEDTNEEADVFLFDQTSETLRLVSTSSSGEHGNGWSSHPNISGNGRYIVFTSGASNLTPEGAGHDLYDRRQVYVKDLVTGQTRLVSKSLDGAPANGSSVTNGGTRTGGISDDGRYVVFESSATDLTKDAKPGVFLRDMETEETINLSAKISSVLPSFEVSIEGDSSISNDGRYIAFYAAEQFTGSRYVVLLYDRIEGDLTVVSRDLEGNPTIESTGFARISGSGEFVSFHSSAEDLVADDTNGTFDVFVYHNLNELEIIYQLPNFGESGKPFKQTDQRWAGDAYGWNTETDNRPRYTIGNYGCNMTVGAMIANYYARRQGKQFHTDPGDLNTWLRANHGYDEAMTKQPSIITYAGQSGVQYWFDADLDDEIPNYLNIQTNVVRTSDKDADAFVARTKEEVNTAIGDNKPVMVGVKSSTGTGHFVALTGIARVNGVDTWLVHDPLRDDVTTLYPAYGNRYYRIRGFKPLAVTSSLSVLIPLAPNAARASATITDSSGVVGFVLTDPLGRRTGVLPDQQTLQEIPEAIYLQDSLTPIGSGPGLQWLALAVANPTEGVYTLTIAGSGTYPLTVETAAMPGSYSRAERTVSLTSGLTESYVVAYASDAPLTVTPVQSTNQLYLPSVVR